MRVGKGAVGSEPVPWSATCEGGTFWLSFWTLTVGWLAPAAFVLLYMLAAFLYAAINS